MRTTITGPYPRVGSKLGNQLRKELNKTGTDFDCELVQILQQELTKEIVKEQVSAGITLPNSGLTDVHNELTWILEFAEGIEFCGMKKIFHTNTHYREPLAVREVRPKQNLISQSYSIARQICPTAKLELTGPYTLARHTIIGEKSPYINLAELATAYALFLREYVLQQKDATFVQFNEPSITSQKTSQEDLKMLPCIYEKMLEGITAEKAVWTYYGEYSPETLDVLLSLPVDVVGLDFVWHPEVGEFLKHKKTRKTIGIGIIDSGDKGYIGLEDKTEILCRIKQIGEYVDFDKTIFSSNATLEHLPRDYARQKIKIIGELARGAEQ